MRRGSVQLEGGKRLSVLDSLRKGFGFFLMSFGVSSPVKRPKPAPRPDPKPEDRKG
jgi:hypothetical protein